jgi:hypothetical protein
VPLADGERGGADIVLAAEIGSNSPSLGAKPFQLMFGQETPEAFGNALRLGIWLMRVAAPQGATGDRKALVHDGYVGKTAVRQPGFLGMDERPETAADGEVVEHAITREQRGARIQQLVEYVDVWNPGMLGCQEHELERPATQATAELPQEFRRVAQAFIDNDPFDGFHDLVAIPRATQAADPKRSLSK